MSEVAFTKSMITVNPYATNIGLAAAMLQLRRLSATGRPENAEDPTISKTDAISRYHLSPKDMEGLSFEPLTVPIKIGGRYRPMPKYNYNEMDVKMRAWKKYGGPEGFERMLNTKARTFYKRYGGKRVFPKPSTSTLRVAHNTA